MNNKINIAEILKNCPMGMKLYSSLFGSIIEKDNLFSKKGNNK